jgi:protein-disulfide isomerase
MGTTAVCAVVVTGLLLFRTFGSPKQPSRLPDTGGAVSDSLWRLASHRGRRIDGGENADTGSFVTLVVFSDFECPFCGVLARTTLPAVIAESKGRARVIFRHWPLPNHRLARPTAIAAACAGEQGRFRDFHDRVFALQDSLGLISFIRFAREAGVGQLNQFEACLAAGRMDSIVEEDARLAMAVGGRGTPTVLLEGRRLPPSGTTLPELSRHVRDAISRLP